MARSSETGPWFTLLSIRRHAHDTHQILLFRFLAESPRRSIRPIGQYGRADDRSATGFSSDPIMRQSNGAVKTCSLDVKWSDILHMTSPSCTSGYGPHSISTSPPVSARSHRFVLSPEVVLYHPGQWTALSGRSPYSASTLSTPTNAFSMSTRWNRCARPISTVIVGIPSEVATDRSDPRSPSPE